MKYVLLALGLEITMSPST